MFVKYALNLVLNTRWVVEFSRSCLKIFSSLKRAVWWKHEIQYPRPRKSFVPAFRLGPFENSKKFFYIALSSQLFLDRLVQEGTCIPEWPAEYSGPSFQASSVTREKPVFLGTKRPVSQSIQGRLEARDSKAAFFSAPSAVLLLSNSCKPLSTSPGILKFPPSF